MFPSDVTEAPPPGGVCSPEAALLTAQAAIAGHVGTINVATAGLVDAIVGVIGSGDWAGRGYRSIEHWVAVHAGVSARRAKDLCLVARRAGELPVTLGRFREGRISEDQVTPIARHVPADHEASVADLAEPLTPSQVARVTSSYRFDPKPDDGGKDDDEPTQNEKYRDQRDHDQRRSLQFGWDEDGWLSGSFRLPADQGGAVKQALELSRHILFEERESAGDSDKPQEAPLSWADALVRMADIALGADMTGRHAKDRCELLVNLDVGRLDQLDEADAYLHLGPAISPGVLRYLTCDGTVRVMLESAGVAINEGRKHRVVNRRLRRAVENRDRGCRFPGCTNTRWLAAHHIIHWPDGGPTETWNLVCLCAYHHSQLHKHAFTITGNADKPNALTFTDHFGQNIPTGPRPGPPPNPPPKGNWTHPTGEPLPTPAIHLKRTQPATRPPTHPRQAVAHEGPG